MRRLYRSSENRLLGGVCGGVADYFNVDPTLIRLAWILFIGLAGTGLLAYLLCCFIIPND